MNRYLLKCESGIFMIVLEGSTEEFFMIDMSCSYKIVPKLVEYEKEKISFITTGFMDTNEQCKIIFQEKDSLLYCEGIVADYGVATGIAEPYDGLTPYEEMMSAINGKEIREIPIRSEEEIQKKVKELLQKMTLKEKIGQMSQSSGEEVSEIGMEIEGKPMTEQIESGEIGSIIYVGYSPETIFSYQKKAVEKTRLGIPLLVCQDVVHGFQTIFPIPLAQSCSFDMKLIEKSAEIAAKEASNSGIMCAFAPMLDLSRDPRWGRVCEGSGEDPYLGGEIAEAVVKGYQGDGIENKNRVAACLKHFIGYAACEGGRDYNTTEISEYSLQNMYAPAFRKGIDAGAQMVMAAFTFLNGRPVTANKEILSDMLREQLGFDGIVVTDYAAVKEVGIHGCGKDWKNVTEQVFHAGVDLEMATSYYNTYLEKLVKEGEIAEEEIDRTAGRILALKYRLGIMDDPYRYIHPQEAEKIIYSKEHLEATEKMAEESIVLLKNKGILPVQKSKTIALIGPFANEKDMLGSWQFSNYLESTVTIKDGLEQEGFSVIYEQGCGWNEEIEGGIERAVQAAISSDIILFSAGEPGNTTGEATSKGILNLPFAQRILLKQLRNTGKPILLILTNGRPLLLTDIERDVDGIVETWFLGAMAGKAIAGVISGRVNPSGKLSMSFPMEQGQIPVYYNHYNTGRPNDGSSERFMSRYLDISNEPLYPFGYGLNYGKCSITEVQLDKPQFMGNESLKVKVTLENQSDRACTEVVQLYLGNRNAMYVRPVRELKAFERVFVNGKSKETVTFEITSEKLKYYSPKGKEIIEKGKYQLSVGLSSREEDLVKIEFNYE